MEVDGALPQEASVEIQSPKRKVTRAGESRQKAKRKLERGLMPNEHVMADAKRAF